MTQLETLIQTLCPNGVKRYKLKEIAELKRGVVISKDYINEHAGEYPVYSSQTENNGCLGYIDTYAYDGTYLTWTTDGANAGTVFYREGKFNITNVCGLVIVTNPQISVKYLYYILSITAPKYVNRGMGNPKLMSNVMQELQIPLPPLAVQSEIVRILDKFTLYKSELAAELAARLQQYEYYRDQLLTFDDSVKRVKLGEVGKICMCKRILKSETNTVKGIPFYKIGTFGRIPDAYISEELFEEYKNKYNYPLKGQILISASGTIGRTVIFDGEPAYFQDSNIIWIDNREELVLNKFLYYYYQLQPWNVSTGGTIARLYSYNIENAVIPIPSLEVQERIVSILDRFDKLCHDIREGLPAEIDLRQKQYEHYRDRLLTFEAAK
jgi:type I restriction enzyme S subunit